jgi:hypothetical protein
MKFARTCRYVHEIIKPIMDRYASQSAIFMRKSYGYLLYEDSLGRIHSYYGPVMVSPKKCMLLMEDTIALEVLL